MTAQFATVRQRAMAMLNARKALSCLLTSFKPDKLKDSYSHPNPSKEIGMGYSLFPEMLLYFLPLLIFGLPIASISGFVLFLISLLNRKKMNKTLPVEEQKSTRGPMIGCIVCGTVALTVIVLFIALVGLVNTGVIRLM